MALMREDKKQIGLTKVGQEALTVVMASNGYPGAYHDFDVGPRPPRERHGHHIEYNEAAARDAFARTRAFFDQRLRPSPR